MAAYEFRRVRQHYLNDGRELPGSITYVARWREVARQWDWQPIGDALGCYDTKFGRVDFTVTTIKALHKLALQSAARALFVLDTLPRRPINDAHRQGPAVPHHHATPLRHADLRDQYRPVAGTEMCV